jgi:hypothetical protein
MGHRGRSILIAVHYRENPGAARGAEFSSALRTFPRAKTFFSFCRDGSLIAYGLAAARRQEFAMRFVCEGQAYDTADMELVKLDDFVTAIYVDHRGGESFLQTWDDSIGVRVCRITDEEIRKLKERLGWGRWRGSRRRNPD